MKVHVKQQTQRVQYIYIFIRLTGRTLCASHVRIMSLCNTFGRYTQQSLPDHAESTRRSRGLRATARFVVQRVDRLAFSLRRFLTGCYWNAYLLSFNSSTFPVPSWSSRGHPSGFPQYMGALFRYNICLAPSLFFKISSFKYW